MTTPTNVTPQSTAGWHLASPQSPEMPRPASPPFSSGARPSVDLPGRPDATEAGRQTAFPATPGHYRRGGTVTIWGVPFDRLTMRDAITGIGHMIADRVPRYVITANLNYAMLAAEDPQLGPVTRDAAMILADGQPIVWRSWLEGDDQTLPCRVAGSEMIFRLAQEAARQGWRVYFLGAEPGVAQACADNLCELYPGLDVAGVHSPPYKKLSPDEHEHQLAQIRAARPDILLVAFGQPKGEKWIRENAAAIGVPVSIQVGASFDFAAGRVKRAPLWAQRLGLEWAHRMMSDPMRLVPRYYRNAMFLATTLVREWATFVSQRYGNNSTRKP